MRKRQLLIKREGGHEIVGLLVMLCVMLGTAALRYALFLPQFIH